MSKRHAMVVLAGVLAGGCRCDRYADVGVPHTTVKLDLDGQTQEPTWNAMASRTGPFLDAHGKRARPFSEVRFLWDATNLYVLLYAADTDIVAHSTAHDGPFGDDDAFKFHLTPVAPNAPTYTFEINATGIVRDARRAPGAVDDVAWESGIKLGVGRMGTLNESTRDDVEWLIEAGIPLASLGLAPRPGTQALFGASRCDKPHKTDRRVCASFGTEAEPKLIEFLP